jgi:hypothetical protein
MSIEGTGIRIGGLSLRQLPLKINSLDQIYRSTPEPTHIYNFVSYSNDVWF